MQGTVRKSKGLRRKGRHRNRRTVSNIYKTVDKRKWLCRVHNEQGTDISGDILRVVYRKLEGGLHMED